MSNIGEDLDKKLFAIETMVRQEANRATEAENKLTADLVNCVKALESRLGCHDISLIDLSACAGDIRTLSSRLKSHGASIVDLEREVQELLQRAKREDGSPEDKFGEMSVSVTNSAGWQCETISHEELSHLKASAEKYRQKGPDKTYTTISRDYLKSLEADHVDAGKWRKLTKGEPVQTHNPAGVWIDRDRWNRETGDAILGRLVRGMRHGWQLRRSHPNPSGAELWTVLMGGCDCYGATPEDALRAAKEHK